MVIYLHEALDKRLASSAQFEPRDIEAATIEGAVLRLRPKLMTVAAVIASLGPILWETGIGSDVMKPIAAPIVGGVVSSTIAVMILVPIYSPSLKSTLFAEAAYDFPALGVANPEREIKQRDACGTRRHSEEHVR
jgi:Cu(I)/Ag(I) efflux system membrane protein CusA/SilA